jgi:hypothetical protein
MDGRLRAFRRLGRIGRTELGWLVTGAALDWQAGVAREALGLGPGAAAEREHRAAGVPHDLLVTAAITQAGGWKAHRVSCSSVSTNDS